MEDWRTIFSKPQSSGHNFVISLDKPSHSKVSALEVEPVAGGWRLNQRGRLRCCLPRDAPDLCDGFASRTTGPQLINSSLTGRVVTVAHAIIGEHVAGLPRRKATSRLQIFLCVSLHILVHLLVFKRKRCTLRCLSDTTQDKSNFTATWFRRNNTILKKLVHLGFVKFVHRAPVRRI